MNDMKRIFCNNCNTDKDCFVKKDHEVLEIKGNTFEVDLLNAYCGDCGDEVYDPLLFDENQKKIDEAYRKQTGTITISEIKKIMEDYSIGAEPLAILLGWGSQTIQRYLAGQIPSRKYSEKLFELKNKENMIDLIHSNGDSITEVARRKVLNSLGERVIPKPINVFLVAQYCLRNEENYLTNMALNKILYYAQGWFLAFYNKPMFAQKIQAWAYGPVVSSIYGTYKAYGNAPISKDDIAFDDNQLAPIHKHMLDSIINAYGNYSATKLSRMTHIESPWLDARKGLEFGEPSEEEITISALKEYFENLKYVCMVKKVDEIKRAAITTAKIHDDIEG